jgi:hypothetical protein
MTRVMSRRRDTTPDAHLFPTRPYDLVKEFVIATVVIGALTFALAIVFSSPDRKAISLAQWAQRSPDDVVATAVGELAGTTTSASYGPPYNNASTGQKLGPLSLQKWAGVRLPVNSANDLVIAPLRDVASTDPALRTAIAQWSAASSAQQASWAQHYSDVLAKQPTAYRTQQAASSDGPVPAIANKFLALARSGALQSLVDGRSTFYANDQTKSLLLLSDGAYLEDQARADHLGGDQWGMMNETGNYPGQPWMWLYTFWYQIKPFSTSGNADALVWGLMVVLTALLVFVPFIPGLRSVPRWIKLYKLVWRQR